MFSVLSSFAHLNNNFECFAAVELSFEERNISEFTPKMSAHPLDPGKELPIQQTQVFQGIVNYSVVSNSGISHRTTMSGSVATTLHAATWLWRK